jgi:hypothetical protein
MADERTVAQIVEGLHAMLDRPAAAIGDVNPRAFVSKSLRDLTAAVEKLDQRISELWPGA